MNTATKTGIIPAKKIGDKYGKNLMDTGIKSKELILLKQMTKK